MKYTIHIKMESSEQGVLKFSHGPVSIDTVCYYASTTPIKPGEAYTGAATKMDEKQREAIFLKEFDDRGIFIHEGDSVAWSKNCVVINKSDMIKMWNHIDAEGDMEKYVISIKAE